MLGPVDPASLGITIPHEHLLIDLGPRFIEPDSEEGRALARQPVSLENLSWVRRNYLSNLDNIRLTDERVAIEEASLFRRAGGGTIVDAGSIGIRPDPFALQRISRATGLHVVAATGYYTEDFHPPDMDARTEDELTREIVGDLRDGIGETGIRAGIIGELGCSWPLHPNERKGLRAAARAQRETGAPITVHPGRDQSAPFEILEVLVEAGADVRRVVMGHVERTGFDVPTLLRLARTGCYVEYDWFGEVLSMHPTGPVDVPSDAERIDRIRLLIDEGHWTRCSPRRTSASRHVSSATVPAAMPTSRRTSWAGWPPRGCRRPRSKGSSWRTPRGCSRSRERRSAALGGVGDPGDHVGRERWADEDPVRRLVRQRDEKDVRASQQGLGASAGAEPRGSRSIEQPCSRIARARGPASEIVVRPADTSTTEPPPPASARTVETAGSSASADPGGARISHSSGPSHATRRDPS